VAIAMAEAGGRAGGLTVRRINGGGGGRARGQG
jgi:hypothetical protein